MALETFQYIDDLNASNPTATDNVSQGDDHIRGIKTTLKNTFPNVTGAITATEAELNKMDGCTATTTELNYVDGVTSNIQTQLNSKAASSSLGNLATLNSVNAATITDNSVGAAELNVSGNGTSGQVLKSDGDGSFSWVDASALPSTSGHSEHDVLNLNSSGQADWRPMEVLLQYYAGATFSGSWTSNVPTVDSPTQQSGNAYSNNHGHETSSQSSFIFPAGSTISYGYLVQSEGCCDKMTIWENGSQVFNGGGNSSGNRQFTGGQLDVKYQKDGSASAGNDTAYIQNLRVNNQTTSGPYPITIDS